ncbi:hypothetical protein GPROT1_00801 [Gammaproteobacteria bacterium]|nr:hypothetical protein GPROT1_00801 [Gammaproteobacteria bacterium]
MIIGTTAHDGSDALGHHWLDADDNKSIEVCSSGLLADDDVFAALAELRRLAGGSRARKPFVHVFASPSAEYSDDQWSEFWDLYEEEFNPVGQPWMGVNHDKSGIGGRVAHPGIGAGSIAVGPLFPSRTI